MNHPAPTALVNPNREISPLALNLARVVLALAVLLLWELLGRFGDPTWISQPSAIAERLWSWLREDLWLHVGTTLLEMLLGLMIGVPLGTLSGLVLGRMPILGRILRPIIVALYNTPMITVAPLLILWFGLGLTPKVYLVAIVTFFLMFFSSFSGAGLVDGDLTASLDLMGASRVEKFFKLVLPASMPWIMSGLKIALPYALIDAVTGEMLAARQGLGFLLTSAVGQIDMAAVYAVLVVLMALGVAIFGLATLLERSVLHWRNIDGYFA